MIDFKKSEKRIPFMRWAKDWCRETGTQLCGKAWESEPHRDDGSVATVGIEVVDWTGFYMKSHKVTLYPGAVAEVCGYIPRGFRHGHTARFVKGGDMMVV